MKILVIDGQGGKLGYEIIKKIKETGEHFVYAIGLNAIATQAMMKAKPDVLATGENPVKVNSKHVDVIIGPIGICIEDSMHGEVTKTIANAVSTSSAIRMFIPINKCENIVLGVKTKSLDEILDEMCEKLSCL